MKKRILNIFIYYFRYIRGNFKLITIEELFGFFKSL